LKSCGQWEKASIDAPYIYRLTPKTYFPVQNNFLFIYAHTKTLSKGGWTMKSNFRFLKLSLLLAFSVAARQHHPTTTNIHQNPNNWTTQRTQPTGGVCAWPEPLANLAPKKIVNCSCGEGQFTLVKYHRYHNEKLSKKTILNEVEIGQEMSVSINIQRRENIPVTWQHRIETFKREKNEWKFLPP